MREGAPVSARCPPCALPAARCHPPPAANASLDRHGAEGRRCQAGRRREVGPPPRSRCRAGRAQGRGRGSHFCRPVLVSNAGTASSG